MKKLFIIITAASMFSSCANFYSKTVIRPQKAFELGEGRHGSYTASITNDCAVPVDIYQAKVDGPEEFMITLQPAEKQTIKVGADTKAIFKNNSKKKAALILKLSGNPGNLSMGGPNY